MQAQAAFKPLKRHLKATCRVPAYSPALRQVRMLSKGVVWFQMVREVIITCTIVFLFICRASEGELALKVRLSINQKQPFSY